MPRCRCYLTTRCSASIVLQCSTRTAESTSSQRWRLTCTPSGCPSRGGGGGLVSSQQRHPNCSSRATASAPKQRHTGRRLYATASALGKPGQVARARLGEKRVSFGVRARLLT
eukprot:133901-Chlamydomonas_euryale.AAC.3